MRSRAAPLGALGALPPPADRATMHLCPLVTARTRSTLRPPGGQASRPVWVPLTAVPSSAADAIAAGLDARPPMLDRSLQVNVATGAVRVACRGHDGALRADAKHGLIGWLAAWADRMEGPKRETGDDDAPATRPLSITRLCVAGCVDAGPFRLTMSALATPVGSSTPMLIVLHCVLEVEATHPAPTSLHCVHVRRTRGAGGVDAWVLRFDGGDERIDWWPAVGVPPRVGEDGVASFAFEVEGDDGGGVRRRWVGDREVRVGVGGMLV